MIGYKMSSSHAKVYTMTNTSLIENFKHDEKNDIVANKITLFVR